jgi:protein-tyrosine phosphatase
VTPHLWIGGKLNRREVDQALRSGVTAILDLTAEFSESKPFREIPYCNIQVLDLTAPTQKQLWEMAGFIAAHVQTGIVYVHCKIGYSRSAAAVAAYLLSSGRVERAEDALAMIRRARPSIIIRSEIVSALDRFEKELSRGDEQRFVLASVDQALA